MKISILILTYNSSNVLSESIDNILNQMEINNVDYELNILNNGSSDNTEEIINSKDGKINYFKNEKNETFTKGFNFLLSKSNGSIYYLMSDDIILKDNFTNYTINFFKKKSNTNIVLAPKTFLNKNKLDRINKKKLNEIDLLLNFTILSNIFRIKDSPLPQDFSCNSEVLQDSCLIFSNEVKNKFFFNESLKFYFTEDILCLDLNSKDIILRYDTNIYVKHYLKVATKKKKNTEINMIYYMDCLMYSSIISNKFFHYLIFTPLIYLTLIIKYFKWKLDPDHYT